MAEDPFADYETAEAIVSIVEAGTALPPESDTLLAKYRRNMTFMVPCHAEAMKESVSSIVRAIDTLSLGRFNLIGHGAAAAVALWVAREREAVIGSVVVVAPSQMPEPPLAELKRPVLALFGTEDVEATAERCAEFCGRFADCHLMYVYGAGRAIGADRPEALAFIAREFFERRDHFLVTRESGLILP